MRKSEIIIVPPWAGRDAGKVFRLTEMPAAKAEKWAVSALLLLNGSGERIPDNIIGRGMEAIAIIGINVFLKGTIRMADLSPLFDEMFECIEIIRDPKNPDAKTREPIAHQLLADDIEEVRTRLWLRSEVMRLHTGFSPAAALSSLLSAIRAPALETM